MDSVPFFGAHQAGIDTPAQEFLQFAAFDLTSSDDNDLRALLVDWTAAVAALSTGETFEPTPETPGAPPTDTGEAAGLGPQRLTVTIGFGPGVFGAGGQDRFGLARRQPPGLAPLPAFGGESLDRMRSGGDLCVQACAESPQVAFHAMHVLTRLANGVATLEVRPNPSCDQRSHQSVSTHAAQSDGVQGWNRERAR
jgi:deferrochelatase/peroxidase EfeB